MDINSAVSGQIKSETSKPELIKSDEEKYSEANPLEVSDVKRPRPQVVVGRTHEILTPFGKAFVTVNRNGENGKKPFEVFVVLGKSGSDTAALAEALGRLISGWLRSAAHPNKALEEIAYQLRGIGGSTSVGYGINRVSSIPDAVAKVLINELDLSIKLEEHNVKLLDTGFMFNQESLFESDANASGKNESGLEISRNVEDKIYNGRSTEMGKNLTNEVFKNASVCPECGNLTLVEVEGCIKCHMCAYSRC